MTSSLGRKSSCSALLQLLLLLLLQLLSVVSIVIATAPEVKATDAAVNINKPVPFAADSSAGSQSSDAVQHLQKADHLSDDVTDEKPEAASSVDDKRAMSALRLGRRAMSALRLGRRSDGGDLDDEAEMVEKRKSMSMLRLGRAGNEEHQLDALTDDEEKRAMSALRLGRKRSDAAIESEVAGDELIDDEKRAMGMLRLGRSGGDNEDAVNDDVISDGLDKRAMGMLRLGRSGSGRIERRKSMSMLRLG